MTQEEIRDMIEGENGFTPSKRVSYSRSLKRLIGLGLIEMTLMTADVAPYSYSAILRTRRFKLFQLTEEGIKEVEKMRKWFSEIIEEFQNLL